MHIFTCIPKLWWYATVVLLENTVCDAWKTCKDLEFSVAAILKILIGGYHKNQVICPHILCDLLHKISSKYSHEYQGYSNFEFSVVAILNFCNGDYYKKQVICPQIWYDLLYSWQSIHIFSCKYLHVYQSYSNFEFSVAAILKIQNGGRHSSQITCLYFLYDSNNKKTINTPNFMLLWPFEQFSH